MATKTKAANEAEISLAVEVRETEVIGGALSDWFRGLRAFFTTAAALELEALDLLSEFQEMRAPVTVEDDIQLQKRIQLTSAKRKPIETHWEICGKLHRLHRLTTARRSVALDALDQANGIGNRYHNEFKANAERVRLAEERRIREEAEQLARHEREQELARAEQDALEREAAAPELSEREALFVDLVAFGTSTPENAANRAGFKAARAMGRRLSAMPKILAAIKSK